MVNKINDAIDGLTICMCCHNSAQRLPPTILHLQQQQTTVPWTLLIIDNGSTDGTADQAQALWAKNPVAPMLCLREDRLGLSYARHRGIIASAFNLVAFIDDDNWIDPDWISTAYSIFKEKTDVAVAAGRIDARYEIPPPDWLKPYTGHYAITGKEFKPGYIQRTLYGAGLILKRSIYQQLCQLGFVSRLSDRTGKQLHSGGDFELCYAFLLAGYRLWFDERLHLQHFIPKERLDINYFFRLQKAFGQQSIYLEVYEKVLEARQARQTRIASQNWFIEAAKASYHVLRHSLAHHDPTERFQQQLIFHQQMGRLQALIQAKNNYNRSFQDLWEAPWYIKN